MKFRSKKWFRSIAAAVAVMSLVCGGRTALTAKAEEIPQGSYVKLDERLGVRPGAVLEELSAHEHDGYYLGTPYDASPFTEENCMRPNGANGGNGGMNCTGFVASVLEKCGADLSGIAGRGYTGGKINASNWYHWILEHAVESYHFQTVEELLRSGLAQKGDVIYFEPISWAEPGADCHIGFFWGNTSGENRFWHSATHPERGNQISELVSKSPSTVYLFKITHTGDFELLKKDADPGLTQGNPLYSLAGAEFTLTRKASGTVAAVLKTDASGYARAEGLEEGEYELRETKAPAGYAWNLAVQPITIRTGETVSHTWQEEAQYAPVELLLEKQDAETKEKKAQGGASFKDAEFTVRYYPSLSEQDPAKTGAKLQRTWVFRCDEEGKVRLSPDYLVQGDPLYEKNGTPVLPLGTVTIQETKAPEGYHLCKTTFVQTIRPQSQSKEPALKAYQVQSIPEQVIRGGLELVKVKDGTMERMANIPFRITSKTTGESMTIETDCNGCAQTEPDALPYDRYEIQELPCEQNVDRVLIPAFEVSVYQDHKIIHLGTLTNDRKPVPELHTTAMDEASGTHRGTPRKEAVIKDTVAYQNLEPEKTYVLKGILMDSGTGEPLLLEGQPIEAEVEFCPEAPEGEVEVLFYLDASGLAGTKLVVFETLYEGETLITAHADLEDEGQTVTYEEEPEEPENPEEPQEPQKPEEPEKPEVPEKEETLPPENPKHPVTEQVGHPVKTGDAAGGMVLIFSLLLSCAGAVICARIRDKR